MRRHRIPVVLITLSALLVPAVTALAQGGDQNHASYLTEKTPWGDPNLQGVWDRRTITPLERPERFADKAFFTPDEIRAYEEARGLA